MNTVATEIQDRDLTHELTGDASANANGNGNRNRNNEHLCCRKLEAYQLPPTFVECHSIGRGGVPQPLFWPCVGEHPVYDSRMYAFLTSDTERNRQYDDALEQMAPGKTVLDVGTGDCAHWAVRAVRAGARRAYAIEKDRFAAARAKQVVAKIGLGDRITIIEGESNEVALPERVDVCVSEILGEIGSAEGAIEVLNDVRRRMLVENGTMLPYLCDTLIAPVSLPQSIASNPSFDAKAVPYLWKIFGSAGRPFDVRVSVAEHEKHCRIVADPEVFERLIFDAPIDVSNTVEATFSVEQDATVHGFFLWLSLQCAPGASHLDTLNTETNWFPVFFPVWPQGIELRAGDRIELSCVRRLSDDGIHPDYFVNGVVLPRRGSAQTFAWESFHHAQSFRCNGFYRALLGS